MGGEMVIKHTVCRLLRLECRHETLWNHSRYELSKVTESCKNQPSHQWCLSVATHVDTYSCKLYFSSNTAAWMRWRKVSLSVTWAGSWKMEAYQKSLQFTKVLQEHSPAWMGMMDKRREERKRDIYKDHKMRTFQSQVDSMQHATKWQEIVLSRKQWDS